MPLAQGAVELEPTVGFSLVALGAAHLYLNEIDLARTVFERACRSEEEGRAGSLVGCDLMVAECDLQQGNLDAARKRGMRALSLIEQSDHMYRDTNRSMALICLARIAEQRGDKAGARVALKQSLEHLSGRPATLGGGTLRVRSLSDLAVLEAGTRSRILLQEAELLWDSRAEGNFLWTPLNSAIEARASLTRAKSILS